MFIRQYSDDHIVLGLWDCRDPDPAWSPRERADLFEFVVPIEGCLARERRGQVVMATPNVALLANAGDTYRFSHPDGLRDRCALILLRERGMEDLARSTAGVLGGHEPSFRVGSCVLAPQPFLALQRLMHGAVRADGVRVAETVGSILASALAPARGLRERPSDSRAAARQRRAVHRAMAFMAARYHDAITLERVAREAAYSPFHFARVFRRHAGLPVHRYVTRLRLREAVDALLEGESDLSALALRLGFSSHSHFAESFRREFGASPSTVRDGAAQGFSQ